MGFNESSIFDFLYSRGDYMPSSVRIQPAVQRRRPRDINVRGDPPDVAWAFGAGIPSLCSRQATPAGGYLFPLGSEKLPSLRPRRWRYVQALESSEPYTLNRRAPSG